MTIQDADSPAPSDPVPWDTVPTRAETTLELDRSWTVQTPTRSRRPASTEVSWFSLTKASTARQLRARYRESSGRGMWNIVQPVIMVLIYGFVFTQIFGAEGTETLEYLTMAWAGIICWQYFQQGAQMGMWSFVHEAGTLPKVWYPRVVVPLTPATIGGFDLLIGLAILLVVGAVQGVRPSIEMIAMPIPLLLLAVWTYAAGLLLAPVTVFVRDLTTFVPLILRLGFFASPVMYSAELYAQEGYAWVGDANPIGVAITGLRSALGGQWPQWNLIAIHMVVGLVMLGLGLLYLRRVENRLVDAL